MPQWKQQLKLERNPSIRYEMIRTRTIDGRTNGGRISISWFLLTMLSRAKKKKKRSKDLGALLDSCSRDDIGNFLQSADLYQKLTAAD